MPVRYDIGIVLAAIAASWVTKTVVIVFVSSLAFTAAIAITQNVYEWVNVAPPSGIASIDVGKLGTVIGLVGVPAFMVAIYIADQRYRHHRPPFPSLTMDIQVTRVRASQNYHAVIVMLNAKNTGTGTCRVNQVIWQLKVLAPYYDESVAEMRHRFSTITDDDPDIEFPWNEMEAKSVTMMILIEPNETEQMTHDFIIPAEINAIVVSAWVRNSSNPLLTEGWYRRTVHVNKES